jgi:hypothetical protein
MRPCAHFARSACVVKAWRREERHARLEDRGVDGVGTIVTALMPRDLFAHTHVSR